MDISVYLRKYQNLKIGIFSQLKLALFGELIMNLKIVALVFFVLVVAWISLVNLKPHQNRTNSISTLTPQSIDPKNIVSPIEYKANLKIAENQTNFFDKLFGQKEDSAQKIQFIELDWANLATFNSNTGNFSNRFQFIKGKNIKIEGYITPLESDSPDEITEFLFSPYIGACIHVPPPPSNQAIHVLLDKPIKFRGLWEPMTLFGLLKASNAILKSTDGSFTALSSFSVSSNLVIPSNHL